MTQRSAGRTADGPAERPAGRPGDGDGDERHAHDLTPDEYDSDDPARWPTGRLLSSVTRSLERDWNTHLGGWALNHASMPVLLHLLRGPRTQRELAAENRVTEQTMSRIVERLERNGHVERADDPGDRRRRLVSVTAEGRRVALEAADPRRGEVMATLGLEPDEVARLRGLLVRMVRARGR
ncbi:MarR family winged helix-turn-helix transcriptional regulator [Cellulomonas sp. PhB143]|uniref:MarR family winged helix-turn-helix transcriptional regulator n=1 Tax=Cellulomonas sp. PhB143 TaxID=2485186 RepID=UPI000FA8317D|nr:MarR family winged helix-turn-helix transcriptional regulator [Cellulomonas sp. PhB143]ROS73046.1 DNA-binding MarR family transcriptional regulator [Cellulomonas sp. PhB143]